MLNPSCFSATPFFSSFADAAPAVYTRRQWRSTYRGGSQRSSCNTSVSVNNLESTGTNSPWSRALTSKAGREGGISTSIAALASGGGSGTGDFLLPREGTKTSPTLFSIVHDRSCNVFSNKIYRLIKIARMYADTATATIAAQVSPSDARAQAKLVLHIFRRQGHVAL